MQHHTMMDPKRDRIEAAAQMLCEARMPGRAIGDLPDELAPSDPVEAWAIHQAAVARLGPVVGWKVGAPSPDAEIGVGELTADTVAPSPAHYPADAFRLWAVEAEIAVTFGQDLPPREAPYGLSEILASVATWHAAIEVLDTSFARWRETSPLWKLADRHSHGALVLGPGRARPPAAALATLPVRMLIRGEPVYAHEGGNTGGDPAQLLLRLVNRLRGEARWPKAGDVVTTGSTTPFHQALPGDSVRVEFVGLDPAELTVGS
jgi:2-keto-4-pentenoate hydratase